MRCAHCAYSACASGFTRDRKTVTTIGLPLWRWLKRSVPRVAVEEAAAARRAGLRAQRPAPREGVIELDEVRDDRADALLVAHVQPVREALAEGDDAVFRVAAAAQGDLVQAEGAREAPVERHRGAVAAGKQGARR